MKMYSKAFRRNHGSKSKSASSTFISLHFNKSDEDQLEISYKNDKREIEEVSQSMFYTNKSQSEIFSPKSSFRSSDSAISRSCIHTFTADVLKESYESHFPNSSQYDFEVKSANLQPEKNKDLQLNAVSDNELKLSPAIEAAELIESSNFNHYISNELEISEEVPSSFLSQSGKHLKNEFFPSDSKISKSSDCHKTNVELCIKGNSYFYSIFQNSISIMKYSQNSVKFHIFIAILACVCAPIPSWLSGFLVGAILSSSLVYWLHKPQKNRGKIPSFNFIPHNSDFQKESGVLKGWMNELPPLMSYSPEQYHVSCTRSVYVRLEGSYLRFSFPQKNIQKRAMFNEPRHEMQFTYQQHYDITNATVELLPRGLNNKRLWSKKYPICLRIPNCKGAVLLQGKNTEGVFSSTKEKLMLRTNENNEIVIYLFSRTDRDKNVWFVRFTKATKMKIIRSHSPVLTENKRTMSVDFTCLQDSDEEVDDSSFVKLSLSKVEKFEIYMSALLYAELPFATKKDKASTETKNPSTLTWLNVLIGRLFSDFLVEDVWAQLVSQKIQRKLNRIKLPFFLTELTVKDINLGSALPKIHHASDPCIDEQGLWIDLDVSYNGSFHMTLETKLNLDRFKSETLFPNEEQTKAPICDSDEDSLESSSDDECFFLETDDCSHKESSFPISSSGSTSKKFFKLMDKLAQSSYIQHATKNKYVKRAMNDISNTPLILTVQVQCLTGTLAINIPPWPTDRLWYGFRTNPSLSVTARPKLGHHVVTLTQITEWIEKKLTSEFQKVLVMPNMDDLIIPIMQPAQDIS